MNRDLVDLAELEIVALDCQATGANPDRGHLLEIGWIAGRAGSSPVPALSAVQSCLIRLPAPATIPPAVQRLTGISDLAMARAVSPGNAWRRLERSVRGAAAPHRTGPCPVVIHFARFERPFLRQLHATNASGTAFPFEIICTHEIAKRLMPDLPRRSLRAVAGYLGHGMPEFKRSGDHALATLILWKGLVELMRTRFEIHNLQQLSHWLATFHAPAGAKRIFPMNPERRLRLPGQPGVYRMRGAGGKFLYIGKATSLKQRVNSYFRARAAHPEHILEMLSQARDIDFSVTGSALEAAVLESDDIKRHSPPYNRALRSDRRGLVYVSKDLKERGACCDRRFRVGPLPDGWLPDALRAFAIWLDCGGRVPDDDLPNIAQPMLASRREPVPTTACLKAGLDLFMGNHHQALRSRSALRIVTAIGARLQLSRLKMAANTPAGEGQTESATGTPAEGDLEAPAFEWTPGNIAAAVEGMVMHGAGLMRRAHWYGLLGQGALAWAGAEDPDALKHLMVFHRGDVAYRGAPPAGGAVTPPAGCGRAGHDRCKHLDLATYDRMRVVTTELRRLVRQGRAIDLRLGPKIRLNAAALTEVLPWV